MSLANILQPNNYEIYGENISVTNVDTTTINNQPYPPGAAVIPVLVPNKILRTNNAGNAVLWGDLPHSATPRQVLQTNAGATSSEWTSDISVPGSITAAFDLTANNGSINANVGDINLLQGDINVNGLSGTINVNGLSGGIVTTNLTINDNLSLESGPGSVGQTIVKGAGDTQSWSNLPAASISPGTANQIMITSGGVSQWNSTITPSSINIVGNSTNSLQIANQAGTAGQFIKKNISNIARWTTFSLEDIPASVTDGYILQSFGGVCDWYPTDYTRYYRVYNNTPFDVNTGVNVFANGTVDTANACFTYNIVAGTFTCMLSGTYCWNFKTILSTHNAQSKLVITDGTNVRATCVTDYLAGITSEQPFNFTVILAATAGQIWAVRFDSIGVGGVMNTSAADPVYPTCPTTTLEIFGTV